MIRFFFCFILLKFNILSAISQEADTLSHEFEPIEATEVVEEAVPATPPFPNMATRDFERLPADIRPAKPVERNTVPTQAWKDASNELDYSKDLPKKEPEKKPESRPQQREHQPWFSNAFWASMGKIAQIFIIVFVLGGIGMIIFNMLKQPRNRAIASDGVEITSENLDQYLQETDLQRFLRDALQQQNYALAIRIYYLQIIKDLAAKNAINWSKEKTNRTYLREMRSHHLHEPFRSATTSFERVWYGNEGLNAAQYALLEPQFKDLLSRI